MLSQKERRQIERNDRVMDVAAAIVGFGMLAYGAINAVQGPPERTIEKGSYIGGIYELVEREYTDGKIHHVRKAYSATKTGYYLTEILMD